MRTFSVISVSSGPNKQKVSMDLTHKLHHLEGTSVFPGIGEVIRKQEYKINQFWISLGAQMIRPTILLISKSPTDLNWFL